MVYNLFPANVWRIVEEMLHFDIVPIDDTIELQLKPCAAFICYGDGRVSPCITS